MCVVVLLKKYRQPKRSSFSADMETYAYLYLYLVLVRTVLVSTSTGTGTVIHTVIRMYIK